MNIWSAKRVQSWTFVRISLSFVLFVLLSVTIGVVPETIFSVTVDTTSGVGLLLLTVPALVISALALAVYYLFVRYIEGRRVDELGDPGAPREFAVGLAVALAFILLAFGFYMLVNGIAGGLSFNGVGLDPFFLLATLLLFITVGINEELLFRGAFWQGLEKAFGSFGALAGTAVLFGFVHAFNPNATLFTSLAIALEAGILLGALFLYTRRLWIVFGVHIAWNWLQGAILGSPVSGMKVVPGFEGYSFGESSVLRYEIKAVGLPEWLSGQTFGVEGSLATVIIGALTGFGFLYLAYRKGNLRPPIWWRHRPTEHPRP